MHADTLAGEPALQAVHGIWLLVLKSPFQGGQSPGVHAERSEVAGPRNERRTLLCACVYSFGKT